MHMQQTLGISDVKWRTKKIDKKECAIFLRQVGKDDSEEEDEDDASLKYFCDIISFTMLWHKHYKSIMSRVKRNCTQFQCVLTYSF